ncbi:MAG: Uma2 family endonuclease [Desulfobacterales bacterium]
MGDTAEKLQYTREEYLMMEESADDKSEFYQGEIFAMSGGSRNHSVICTNLIRRIGESLDDKDCILFDGNMKVDIPKADAFVYPDISMVCGDIEFFEDRTDIIRNPVLIIEVLSPATQSFDRGEKFSYYRTLASVREYVLISQHQPLIEVFYKHNENQWLYTVAKGTDDSIMLRTVPCRIFLKDIYLKTDWMQTEPK